RQLVQPPGYAAFGIDGAGSQARAQSQPEHRLIVERHGSCQRRDVSVVGDLDRYPQCGPHIQIDAPDVLVEELGGHLSKQRGYAGFVVDVDPGRADAQRIEPRQVSARLSDRVHDAVEVVTRVALELGMPDLFAGEYLHSVDERSHFAIATTGIET